MAIVDTLGLIEAAAAEASPPIINMQILNHEAWKVRGNVMNFPAVPRSPTIGFVFAYLHAMGPNGPVPVKCDANGQLVTKVGV